MIQDGFREERTEHLLNSLFPKNSDSDLDSNSNQAKVKTYSLRFPFEVASVIDALSQKSGTSRNSIANDIVILGLDALSRQMSEDERSEIDVIASKISNQMLYDHMKSNGMLSEEELKETAEKWGVDQ